MDGRSSPFLQVGWNKLTTTTISYGSSILGVCANSGRPVSPLPCGLSPSLASCRVEAGSCSELRSVRLVARADGLLALAMPLWQLQPREFTPKPRRLPKPNCEAQASGRGVRAALAEPELPDFLNQNTQMPQPFLLFCHLEGAQIVQIALSSSQPMTEAFHALWDSVLLS